MGNKLELLPNIIPHFPDKSEVTLFIDLFGGSGVVSANVDYANILYNELNPNIFNLFNLIKSVEPQYIQQHFEKQINTFGLEKGRKDTYLEFRKYYNETKHIKDLFLLTHYSFSNLIRFNKKEEFNMPVGNQFYNPERHDKIYADFHTLLNREGRTVVATRQDAFSVLHTIIAALGDDDPNTVFIYLDPPYSNTTAVYNEARAHGGWTVEHDLQLFKLLDQCSELGVRWAMSNVLEHKGKSNTHLSEWAERQNYAVVHFANKQYSSLGKGNALSQEVLVKNY